MVVPSQLLEICQRSVRKGIDWTDLFQLLYDSSCLCSLSMCSFVSDKVDKGKMFVSRSRQYTAILTLRGPAVQELLPSLWLLRQLFVRIPVLDPRLTPPRWQFVFFSLQ